MTAQILGATAVINLPNQKPRSPQQHLQPAARAGAGSRLLQPGPPPCELNRHHIPGERGSTSSTLEILDDTLQTIVAVTKLQLVSSSGHRRRSRCARYLDNRFTWTNPPHKYMYNVFTHMCCRYTCALLIHTCAGGIDTIGAHQLNPLYKKHLLTS